jgi:tRNA modification GTPase
MVQNETTDTIAAMATPRGRGGIGIVRISGPETAKIAKHLLGHVPEVRVAEYLAFLDKQGEPLDQGIALFFKGPNSFTGEDVLELQGHGGPVVMDCLLHEVVSWGARIAQPGEFTLRAFLNNKIDLLQAEAIADLINASTTNAARGAMRSLQGVFSKLVEEIIEALIKLRMYVEAAIDFPEEEIDFLSDKRIELNLERLVKKVGDISIKARQGTLVSDGVRIVIAGHPNAGKSSLLNRLTGSDSAIVTDIPGTTRDVLREHVSIDGLLVQFIDTAGLRIGVDVVEEEGIKRALREIELADHVVWVVDGESVFLEDIPFEQLMHAEWETRLPSEVGRTIFYNKIDKIEVSEKIEKKQNYSVIYGSAKTGEGIKLFKEHLKEIVGFSDTNEGNFIARRRHLESLVNAQKHLLEGQRQLLEFRAGELLAEELRLAQHALENITGRFTSDDLLGKIFSEFCIGK